MEEKPEDRQADALDDALDAILKLPEADARTGGELAREHPHLLSRQTFTPIVGAGLSLEQIGEWTILETLGEGGMGTVYKAERHKGALQTAALKVVKPGNAEVVRRFHKERAILAKLNHPNIAHYLDGGTLPDGRPWLAMEHVEGIPLNTYCETNKLNLRARIRLFLKVCDAMSHAHRHMIIHRDVKPANILVDSRGEPRLLDFGIASLLDPETGEQQTITALHQVMMTPEYASPEQVRHEPLGAASDVYSLGVVLYEMLTSQRPYKIEDRSPLGIIRTVCEQPITRPSHLVGQPGQTVQTRSLKGDLDNILLMALARRPSRRYQSVAEFSTDLKAYLRNRPVIARPATFTYRAGKFVRRHTMLIGAAFMVVGFTIGYIIMAHRNHLRLQAEQALTQAERDRAEEITDYLVSLFEITDPDFAMGEILTANMILEQGRRRIMEDLAAKGKTNARILGILGQVYFGLGQWEQSEELLLKSAEIQEMEQGEVSFDNALNLAKLYEKIKEPAEVDAWVQKTLALAVTPSQKAYAAAQHAVLLDIQNQGDKAIGVIQNALGDIPEGNYDSERAFLLTRLGSLYRDRSDYELGREAHNQALAYQAKTGRTSMRTADILTRKANLAQISGELDEAYELKQEVYQLYKTSLGENHPNSVKALGNVADMLRDLGRYDEALKIFDTIKDQHVTLFGPEHLKTATLYYNIAALYKEMSRYEEAEELFRETLMLYKKVYGPRSHQVANCLDGLGAVLNEREAHEDAQFLYEEAINIREESLGLDHLRTGLSYYNLASHLRRQFEPELALDWILKAQAIFIKRLPDNHWLRGVADNTQGYIYGMLKQDDKAVGLMEQGWRSLNESKGHGAHHTRDAAKRLAEFYEARNNAVAAKPWRDWLKDPTKLPLLD